MIRKQIIKYLNDRSSHNSLFGEDLQTEQDTIENLNHDCQSQLSDEEYGKISNGEKYLAKAAIFKYVENAKRVIYAEWNEEYFENISLQPNEHIDSMNANADWEIKSKSVDVYDRSHLFFEKATSINSYMHQSIEKAVVVVTNQNLVYIQTQL